MCLPLTKICFPTFPPNIRSHLLNKRLPKVLMEKFVSQGKRTVNAVDPSKCCRPIQCKWPYKVLYKTAEGENWRTVSDESNAREIKEWNTKWQYISSAPTEKKCLGEESTLQKNSRRALHLENSSPVLCRKIFPHTIYYFQNKVECIF